jgi:hypothetical protein
MNYWRVRVLSIAVLATATCMGDLLAQMAPASGRLLAAMAMNAKQMKEYEWKQRVTVFRKGKPTEPIIDQVRFDSSGKMERTTISAPAEQPSGGIRGRIAANTKSEVKGIMELVGQYNKPQQIVDTVRKGTISESGSEIRVEANSLIQPTDSLTMLVDPTTHHARHIDIRTAYDGSPMTIAQDYSPIPEGPNMMKTMKVSVPQKGLAINIDSYDFVRQTAGN